MLLRRTSIVFAVLGVAAVLILSLATLRAQEGNGESGNALQISPTRTEIIGAPGEKKEFSVTLKNITKGELNLKAILNDFESDNASGTPKVVVDTSKRTPYTLDKILNGLEDLTLKAGESRELKFALDVPTNVSPGAYFGAIRYQVIPNRNTSEEKQVALNASIAHLVFLEVPGEINEQIQLESLTFQREGKTRSFFVNAPDHAALNIKNLGNGFARPFGRVTLSHFGKEVHAYDVNTSNPKGIVLPNSSRIFTDEIKNVKKPGKYTATAGVAYGSGAEVITYESSFWYVPVWCLILLAILLLAIAGGGYYLYRRQYGKNTVKKNKG